MKYFKSALLRFQALSARERVLSLLAAIVVISVVLDVTWLSPQRETIRTLSSQLEQHRNALNAISKVLTMPLDSPIADPLTVERDDLRLRLVRAEATLGPTLNEANLSVLVRNLVSERLSLTLVSLKTLAPEALSKPPLNTVNTLQQDLNGLPIEPRSSALYKHGIEVVVRGDYATLVTYLENLQRSPSRIYWAKAKLEVQTYPLSILTLTIYTVNDHLDTPLG